MMSGVRHSMSLNMILDLLVSLCCVAAFGDTLDVATVSADRNSAAISSSPVRVMSGTEIDRFGYTGLHEALDMFSGVSVRDYGGVGGLKTVSVRNLGAAHTAVVYDGITVSDAQNGMVDISRFNLDDISSVSMSIGMEDDIFCSARQMIAAGVLRLESPAPSFIRGKTDVKANLGYGSFGTISPYVSVRHCLGEEYALKASVNGIFSRGDYPFELQNGELRTVERRMNDDVRSCGAEADFQADWESGGRLRAKVNWHDSERGLPGAVILYTQNSYERLWDKSILTDVMYECSFGEKWSLHADAGFTRSFNRHLDADPAFPAPQDSRYDQKEYSLAVRGLHVPVPGWKISVAEDVFMNELDSNIPECLFPFRVTAMTALTARYENRSLQVTAAAVATYVDERLGKGPAPEDRFRISPIASLSWNFHPGLRLRAGYKEGFRVPTFNDLYYARVGNAALRPEVARQFNLGLTFSQVLDQCALDLTADAYRNSVKDKIVAVPTMFIWKMRNVGKVTMWGADVTGAVHMKVCEWMKIHACGSWSLQYALDVTSPDSKNYRHQIPYTPENCGNASVALEMPWLTVSYRMNAVGRRYFAAQNIPAHLMDGYADHVLALNRTFSFGSRHCHEIYIGAECLNLAGKNYEVIHGYPMQGRSFRITLKYKY